MVSRIDGLSRPLTRASRDSVGHALRHDRGIAATRGHKAGSPRPGIPSAADSGPKNDKRARQRRHALAVAADHARARSPAHRPAPQLRARDRPAPALRRRRRPARASAACRSRAVRRGISTITPSCARPVFSGSRAAGGTAACRIRPASAASPVTQASRSLVRHIEQLLEFVELGVAQACRYARRQSGRCIRSISRMPRCQERNSSRRRRSSSPSLDRRRFRSMSHSNAKSPDGPGAGYIEASKAAMSAPLCTGLHCVRHAAASQHAAHAPARLLNPLFAALTSLPGVGPKLEKLYRASARAARRRASSTCCSICRPARSTAARGRSCSEVVARPGRDRRGHGRRSIARRRRTGRARPTASYTSDDTGDADADLLPRARAIIWRSSCRSARCATSPAPPSSTTACCRWCIPTASSTRRASPSCRWSSRSIRSPKGLRSAMCGARWTARWRSCPTLPEWQDEAWVSRERFPAFAEALARAAPAGRAARRRAGKPRLDAACL